MTTASDAPRRRRKNAATDNSADLETFYRGALKAAERPFYDLALKVTGLDLEIATLRTRLRTAVSKRPQELALMLRGVEVLARLVGKRYALPSASVDELAAAMRQAFLGDVVDDEVTDAAATEAGHD